MDESELANTTGAVAGATSILGSWQVCHALCAALIAVLSVLGITIVGMPLLFLTKIAVPAWIVAVILFVITLILYGLKKCISPAQLLLTAGLIIAGIPFESLRAYAPLYWSIGGLSVSASIILFITARRRCHV